MLRKFLSCVAAIVVLVIAVVPAYAYTTGTPVFYAPITFDSLRTGSSYQLSNAWDFNRVSSGMDVVNLPNFTAIPQIGSYSQANGYASGSVEIYGANSGFQLKGSDQIVVLSQLSSLEIYFGFDGDMLGKVSYSADVMLSGKSGDIYVFDSYLIGGSRDVSGSVAIGEMIANDIADYTNEPYAYIRDLTITVTWADDTIDAPVYEILMHYYQYPQIAVSDWLNRQRLTHTTVVSVSPGSDNFDTVAWMDDLLDGLFAFQLMPGVTIGGLFAIGVGLGILYLFLKIVQAG